MQILNKKEGIFMLKDLCFEIIQTCPNKCKFCSSNSSQDKQTIITFEQFKKTVMHFIKQGGKMCIRDSLYTLFNY